MAKQDFYEILGVARDADEKTLKSAFRKMAMKYHPDRNPDNAEAEAKFKEVNEAYDALRDPQKRAAYDRFGHAAFENGGARGGAGFEGDFASTVSDIFDEFFGMGGQRRSTGGRERGSDLRYDLEVSLEEAFAGKEVEIDVPSWVSCEACSGSGAKAGTSPTKCTTCGGLGRVRVQQGFFTMERTCPACQGRGQQINDPCEACHGQGRVQKERTLSVNIPAGIEDGTRIRLANEGEAGPRGGTAGDLYIFLSISPHEIFQREGADLFCRTPISMTTAALGGSVEVPNIDGGRSRVKIPEGTQTGAQFRLRSKGMPVMRSTRTGDMTVQVFVETPQKLNAKQKELLEEFDRLSSGETNPDAEGFMGKMKGFFS